MDGMLSGAAAIILAGGQGSRFHSRKQFAPLCGRPMWEYAYEKAASLVGEEQVKVVGVQIPGGATRTESVRNGLRALPAQTQRVVIVEAARPMVTQSDLRQLLEDESPSTTFVRPLVNTVVFRTGEYLNREELYELLTPQSFDYKMLCTAYESERFSNMTDETRVMLEYYGVQPHFIETDAPLFKVTYPEDIYLAERLMQGERKEGRSQA